MWYEEAIFYHIYPLGFCGCPIYNDGILANRILKIKDWIPHLKKLGVTAVYLSPIFESDKHGYDTRDYMRPDCRLGTDDDVKEVCDALHKEGIRVVLDGVFNHVGRGFFAFRDVIKNKWNSRYKDWFRLSFDGNTCYNDGFWYEAWEGHYELVKLNLDNREVRDYLFSAVAKWIDEYGIDGLRLDVAYCLNRDFMRELRRFTDNKKSEFYLMGEMLHGDYNQLVNGDMLNSVTNYEFYKSLYSALNSDNLYEISYSQNRQFGYEQWCVYRGLRLSTFLDNHDVSRIATILTDKNKLKTAYTLLFAFCGVPYIYYGSEWGAEGDKKDGDEALRKSFDAPVWNALCDHIAKLAEIRKSEPTLVYGGYKNLKEGNKNLLFERSFNGRNIIVAANIEGCPHDFYHDALRGSKTDLITGLTYNLEGALTVEPYSAVILAD